MKKRIYKLLLIPLCILIPILLTVLLRTYLSSDAPAPVEPTQATTDAPTPHVTVFGEGASAYKIVQPKQGAVSGTSDVASGVRLASSSLGTTAETVYDDSAEAAHEVLIGNTSRSASQTVISRLAEVAEETSFYWVVAEIDGKIVLYASASEGYPLLLDHFLKTYADSTSLKVPKDCYDVHSMTFSAYEEQLKADEAAARQRKLAELRAAASDFRLSDFGRLIGIGLLQNSPYAVPAVYPTKDTHPRILITPEKVGTVRRNLTDPENERAYALYVSDSEAETDGRLPSPRAGESNADPNVLAIIEAKALRYAIEGDEIYGLEAILAMKNYLRTLVCPPECSNDAYKYHSYTVYITACVYDWCYELLTTADKNHLTAAVLTRLAPYLEIGFPPDGEGALCGHGIEQSILCDWLAFAIATSDDFPEIYEFIGGRLFEEYTKVDTSSLASGSSYDASRYYYMLFGELLVRNMTNGSYSLFGELLERPAITLTHMTRPDGQSFCMGDSSGTAYGNLAPIFLAASIYGNATLKNLAMSMGEGGSFQHPALSHVMYLLINDVSLDSENAEPLSLVHYNVGTIEQTIARSAWNDESAFALYMKIGEAYSAEGEHGDAGHFTVYYKSIVASGSAPCDPCDTPQQATVLGHDAITEVRDGKETYLYSYLAGSYGHGTADEVSRYMISLATGDTENPMVFLVYDRITSVDTNPLLLHVEGELTVGRDGRSAIITGASPSRQTESTSGGKLHVQSLLSDVTYTKICTEGSGRIEISPVTDRLLTVMYVTDAQNAASTVSASEISTDAVVGAEIFGKTVVFPRDEGRLSDAFHFSTRKTDGTTEYYLAGLADGRWEISVNGGVPTVYTVTDGGVVRFTGAVGEVTASPCRASLSFELCGGIAASELPRFYTYGEITALPAATRPDFIFLGWYDNSDLEGEPITAITPERRGEITLYAKWQPCFYNVTLELGGGTLNDAGYLPLLIVGETHVLPTAVTLAGASFLGWYDNPSFSGEPITVVPAEREPGDMTFYARYSTLCHRLTFDYDTPDANGGTVSGRISYAGVSHVRPCQENGSNGYLLSIRGAIADNAGGYLGIETLGASGKTLTLSFDIKISEQGAVPWRLRLRNAGDKGKLESWILTTDEKGGIYLGASAGTDQIGTARADKWTNVSLSIKALGDGRFTVDGYIDGALMGSATYISAGNFILCVSDIKRIQLYASSESALTDRERGFETYFDDLTVTCE